MEILFHFNHKVTLNDLDILQHVNNSRYIEWMTDCFSIEEINRHSIKSIQVNYLEETKIDEVIEINSSKKKGYTILKDLKNKTNQKSFRHNWSGILNFSS